MSLTAAGRTPQQRPSAFEKRLHRARSAPGISTLATQPSGFARQNTVAAGIAVDVDTEAEQLQEFRKRLNQNYAHTSGIESSVSSVSDVARQHRTGEGSLGELTRLNGTGSSVDNSTRYQTLVQHSDKQADVLGLAGYSRSLLQKDVLRAHRTSRVRRSIPAAATARQQPSVVNPTAGSNAAAISELQVLDAIRIIQAHHKIGTSADTHAAPALVELEGAVHRAEQLLHQKYGGMVRGLAQRFNTPDVFDLFVDGLAQIRQAALSFDISKGNKFGTYLHTIVRQFMWRRAQQMNVIQVPEWVLNLQNKLAQLTRTLEHEFGREPTELELAHAANVPLAKVRQARQVGRTASLDASSNRADTDDNYGSLLDNLESGMVEDDPVEAMTQHEVAQDVDFMLDAILAPKEAAVLQCRYGLNGNAPMTLVETAAQLNVSRQTVMSMEQRALQKLQKRRSLWGEHIMI